MPIEPDAATLLGEALYRIVEDSGTSRVVRIERQADVYRGR